LKPTWAAIAGGGSIVEQPFASLPVAPDDLAIRSMTVAPPARKLTACEPLVNS
jgi:hypothetical protein